MSGYCTCWKTCRKRNWHRAKDDNPNWEYIDGEIVKLDRWPTVNWISRNSSAVGWSFWLRRVRIFVCWRIC
ncbi:hypothetical protein ACLBOM_29290 [Escherichia coli]